MLRLAHIADSHFDETSRFDECVHVHDWIAADIIARGADLIVHSGDVYERKSTPRERIAVARFFQALATVAQDDKNAALGMGATRWEMLRVTVFPRVRAGIVGAVMLGLGRAMGETIAVALVVGSSRNITTHVFSSGDTMAAVIANEFGEATGTHRAALIGLGVVLFVITIIVNMVARGVLNATGGSQGGKAAL